EKPLSVLRSFHGPIVFGVGYNRAMPSPPPDVRALVPDIVAWRRDFHQHPELAYAETRTAARVVELLSGIGLEVRTGLGGTGVTATTPGPRGPTVMLRADMDGLPIQEDSSAPYASREAGVMHACGHDGHVAMAVGAARVLAARALPRRVRVLFQPAEEG